MAQSPAAAYLHSIGFDAEGKFTKEQMEEFKSEPPKYAKFVKVVEAIVNSRFPSVSLVPKPSPNWRIAFCSPPLTTLCAARQR